MISATVAFGRRWTRRRSSLTTSGRRNGMRASESGSAPTSSRAIPTPAARTRSANASRRAGLRVRARSVSSTTTRMPRRSAPASTAGGAAGIAAGSTLTKSPKGARRPASTADSTARVRHSSSSSSRRPASRAVSNSSCGIRNGPSTGPRASASYATVSPVAISTIGWKSGSMARRDRTASSSSIRRSITSHLARSTDGPQSPYGRWAERVKSSTQFPLDGVTWSPPVEPPGSAHVSEPTSVGRFAVPAIGHHAA